MVANLGMNRNLIYLYSLFTTVENMYILREKIARSILFLIYKEMQIFSNTAHS